MSQLRYWVWLTNLTGLHPLSMRRVLEEFGSPMDVYFTPRGGYDGIAELSDRERALLSDKDISRAEHILDICREKSIRILTLQDADYPERLKEIAAPPPVLYVRGQLPFLDEIPTIGIVGTRKATPYGIKLALKLGQEITAGGGCVVTGMALGIDGAAARGAIAEGGCIGVLGTAIDNDYPASNASLIKDVAATGAIVSEFPPGYPTMPGNFPRRNRIISGLSSGICVVEAPARSGALITADLALEQGRDLFAVPGNADSPASEGSNALLKECARAVTSGAEILSEYEGLYPNRITYRKPSFVSPLLEQKTAPTQKTVVDKAASIPYIDLEQRIAAFPEDQQNILRTLVSREKHVDEIVAETGLSPARALAALTVLTIRRAVCSLPGKRYMLNLE